MGRALRPKSVKNSSERCLHFSGTCGLAEQGQQRAHPPGKTQAAWNFAAQVRQFQVAVSVDESGNDPDRAKVGQRTSPAAAKNPVRLHSLDHAVSGQEHGVVQFRQRCVQRPEAAGGKVLGQWNDAFSPKRVAH
jgi:hypothetical protein